MEQKTLKGQYIDRFSNKVAEAECEISSKPNSILEGKQQEQKLQNLKKNHRRFAVKQKVPKKKNSYFKALKLAKCSSIRLKLVPAKSKNFFTEQNENFCSSQQTDDVLVSGKKQKEIKESKRNDSSSGRSFDGLSLCLYLAFLVIFASQSHCIKLYGYDFDNILSTKTQLSSIIWITMIT